MKNAVGRRADAQGVDRPRRTRTERDLNHQPFDLDREEQRIVLRRRSELETTTELRDQRERPDAEPTVAHADLHFATDGSDRRLSGSR
jgi:hypothetical protein